MTSWSAAITEIAQVIRTAIVHHRSIQAVYGDRERLLYPHMLGRNKDGQLRVLCLQIGGDSARGLTHRDGPGDWRCMALERFTAVVYSTAPWVNATEKRRLPYREAGLIQKNLSGFHQGLTGRSISEHELDAETSREAGTEDIVQSVARLVGAASAALIG
jgi:hypothetical protein